eukprot:Gb_17866 [translate_table: standard]
MKGRWGRANEKLRFDNGDPTDHSCGSLRGSRRRANPFYIKIHDQFHQALVPRGFTLSRLNNNYRFFH